MRISTAIFLVLLAAIQAASAQWNITLHEGRRYVPIEDVTNFYKLNPPRIEGNSFTLTGQGRTIRGSAGGREVYINNVKYVLCFDMVSKGGRFLISAMDVTKIIEPVMRPGKIKNATAVRTVILDAGHGGHDSGARGPLGCEKDAALDVVLRAKKLLEENGFNVRLTRMTDVFIPLENRPAMANKYPNAIFASVHFNKSNVGGASGIETYALAPRGVPSMDEENLSYSDFRPYPGHQRDAENIALATAMHSSLLRHLRLYDRGIKRARFVVIRNIDIPGVLLEGGFMNHPLDARQISSTAYRDAFARAILEGVNRYRSAVDGRMQYFKPSAVVAATDATTAPPLKKDSGPPAPVGSKTDIGQSVNQAADALSTPP
ncbi:MAG: N-acetylmuramoyl-L-alanine amidase [Terrimicrobiaceae bacterium]|nr:N-acetylmuramoyl-L-alanine amidase [Terrimicrobiaceae bacterium]